MLPRAFAASRPDDDFAAVHEVLDGLVADFLELHVPRVHVNVEIHLPQTDLMHRVPACNQENEENTLRVLELRDLCMARGTPRPLTPCLFFYCQKLVIQFVTEQSR